MKVLFLILLFALSTLCQTADDLYRSIEPLSIPERKQIFKQQSEEMKFELWRVHFRKFLPEVNKNQARILRKLIKAKTLEDVRKIEPEIRSSFSYELGRKIFYTLGSDEVSQNPRKPQEAMGFGLKLPPDCVCTTASYNYSCVDDCVILSCIATKDGGCGIMWMWNCNGMCSCG